MLDERKRRDPAGKGDGSGYLEYFKELHKDDKDSEENKDDLYDFFSSVIESAKEEKSNGFVDEDK